MRDENNHAKKQSYTADADQTGKGEWEWMEKGMVGWGWGWVKRSEPKPHVTTTEFASQQDHFLGFTVGVVEFSRLAQGMSISVHATSVYI